MHQLNKLIAAVGFFCATVNISNSSLVGAKASKGLRSLCSLNYGLSWSVVNHVILRSSPGFNSFALK